jgi:hypothetical protein
MPKAAVASDVHEPLDVHGALGAKRTFDLVVALDLATETVHVVVVEILGATIGIDPARREDLLRPCRTDSEDVRQSDLDALAAREIDASDTCHGSTLPLTLLVLGIPRADDPYHAFAADHFAVLADGFHAAADLHGTSPNPVLAELGSITKPEKCLKRPRELEPQPPQPSRLP